MTSNRSGICSQHEEMMEEESSRGFSVTDRRRTVSANPVDRRPSTPMTLRGSDLPALTDLPQDRPLRDEDFTTQIDTLISSSVSLTLKRTILTCITDNGGVDNTALSELHRSTLQKCALSPRAISDEYAIDLAHMVEDEFGPDEEDAVYLAGYALSKKWQLGTSRGDQVDDLGVAYGASYSEYVSEHNRHIRELASEVFIDLISNSLPSLVEESSTKRLPFEYIVQQIGTSGVPHVQQLGVAESRDAERARAKRERRESRRKWMLAEANRLDAKVRDSRMRSMAAGQAEREAYQQGQMAKNIQEINDKLG